MTMAFVNLLLNLLVVGLLMATISYCFVLNKRIKILQDGKSELANLLKHFDESTVRASESIVALQTASKKIGENIQARIDKVNYLMDDLAFMIEKGNRLTDQLDANIAVNRARTKVMAQDPVEEEELYDIPEPVAPKPVLRHQPVLEKPVIEKPVMEKPVAKEKASISLEAVLDRVVGRGKPANQNNNALGNNSPVSERGNAGRGKASSSARSKAEQELLDMIRAGIKG